MKKIELTPQKEFDSMADLVYANSKADHTQINFSDSANMTTRFANNQVIQNVAVRRPRLSVEVAFGKRVGRMSTDKFDPASLKATVAKAEEIARLSPEDPEYMEPLPPQKYAKVDTYSKTTADQEPDDLADEVKDIVDRCEKNGCVGAGIVTANRSHVGISTDKGLRAFEPRTRSSFSLTATLPDSTGWTMNNHRKISKLNIKDRTTTAIEKAKASAGPTEVPAGHWEVILEPAAVAGLLGPMIWMLGAKNYHKGNSPYVGKLNERILDERLQIATEPQNELLLGTSFDSQGMPYGKQLWVQNGVLKKLYYDRFTAQEHNETPTPFPRAITMGFQKPTASSREDLIRETKRGILVTNFWYIRFVNATDMTLTGMTRDGTFLIEDGKITAGVKNFRWHDSPLRVFAAVAGVTAPHEAVSNERGKMLLPYMRLPDFNFSSVTRF
ncbi:MAG: TldD/PmbA family protein [Planctomycetota bacterium]|nr:TldD/PmbA family protein [Planctomycetota bacterium]